MVSSFAVVTRAAVPIERLVLVPHLRRFIRRRNAHLVASLEQSPDRP